ncbi:MAG: hypothetical protein AAFV69_12340, partial [Pseudomonadota bacterium]
KNARSQVQTMVARQNLDISDDRVLRSGFNRHRKPIRAEEPWFFALEERGWPPVMFARAYVAREQRWLFCVSDEALPAMLQ